MFLNLSVHSRVNVLNSLVFLGFMTNLMYLQDAYVREFDATVVSVEGKYVVLDSTLFYAVGGGQPHDEGVLTCNNKDYNVMFVKKIGPDVSHEVDHEGLKVGDLVHGVLDWGRRYRLMRYHTACHVLSAVLHNQTGALITGNQLDVDKARVDFNLDDFSREKIEQFVVLANEALATDAVVKVYSLSKDVVLQDATLVKLAKKEFLDKLEIVRIVEIGSIDKQADGGTHVKSLKEVGTISLLKIENKGKNNRRVYFTLL
jgi:misacylated tRNA(Ala) deacylase